MDVRVGPRSQESSVISTLDLQVDGFEGDIEKVLISEEEIAQAVARLGKEISGDYAGRDLLVVGVLKGAFVMMADLARSISGPTDFDFMAVSSYGAATKTSGVVRILKDLDHDIENRDVLLVEGIVDSGLTLNYLLKNLRSRRPASLEVCALIEKTGAARVPLSIKYRGFEIPDVFVVGFGLDLRQRYRNLPYIATLKPELSGESS